MDKDQIIADLQAKVAELEKDLALKTRDRDVFRDFTLAYEKRIEELEKINIDLSFRAVYAEKTLHMIERHYDQLDTQLHPESTK